MAVAAAFVIVGRKRGPKFFAAVGWIDAQEIREQAAFNGAGPIWSVNFINFLDPRQDGIAGKKADDRSNARHAVGPAIFKNPDEVGIEVRAGWEIDVADSIPIVVSIEVENLFPKKILGCLRVDVGDFLQSDFANERSALRWRSRIDLRKDGENPVGGESFGP